MKLSLALVLLAASVFCTGCEVIINDRPSYPKSVPACPNSVPVYTKTGTEAEIDIAGQLDSESSRVLELNDIAQRRGLYPQEQAYLVHCIYTRLYSESSKILVLDSLISNPEFSDTGKAAVLGGLHQHLSSESSKILILETIKSRGPLPR